MLSYNSAMLTYSIMLPIRLCL